jgi:Glycosyltransferases, probably involved in cell wall biogenesis
MNPKLSVIVPVYNSEKYLERCINSILNQTFVDLELILIDDGSTDNSPKICDRYVAIDNRVKCIHQANQGIAGARNVGINNSNGDFIAFVDNDDYLDINMYKPLVFEIETQDVDLVMCRYYSFDDYGRQYLSTNFPKLGRYSEEEIYQLLILPGIGNKLSEYFKARTMVSVWRSLYKKDLLNKYGIRFKNIKIEDDQLFHMEYLFNISNAYVIDDSYYYYYYNQISESARYQPNLIDIYQHNHDKMENLFKQYNLYNEEVNERFISIRLMSMITAIYREINTDTKKYNEKVSEIKRIINNGIFKENFTFTLCNNAPNFYKKMQYMLIKLKQYWALQLLNNIKIYIKN